MSATAAPSSGLGMDFSARDWALVAGVSLAWGSSFLLIDIGVDHFEPGLVALLRLVFGAATLAAIPAARRRIARADWPGVAALAVLWMAIPFLLFPFAEQRIDSSLAGMINAAAPLFGAVVGAVVTRRLPGPLRVAGLVIGFVGVLLITGPEVDGSQASGLGVGLVLLAAFMYGISFQLTGPLQERNGALPVIFHAQLVALVIDLPFGLVSVPGSSFAWSSLAACVVLGAVGTALAYAWFTALIGRVGAVRGSIAIYFLPAVAIGLGALVRDETILATAIAGTALVMLGAYVTSRSR